MAAYELQGWGREIAEMMRGHADSAVSGLADHADKSMPGEGGQEGDCQCEEAEGGEKGSEESWNGELSPHPSPKTRVDVGGDGYF